MMVAQPNGKLGSGLSIIAGPNNAGKSIIIEALRAMQAAGGDRSFPERSRNVAAGSRIDISLHYGDGLAQTLRTISGGGSETEWLHEGSFTPTNILVVASRRAFQAQFAKSNTERSSYMHQTAGSGSRALTQDSFAGRLFQIQRNRVGFDAVLARVMPKIPKWYIEQGTNGYFLRVECAAGYHDSEGLGDGITSLFVIIDALYDSQPGQLIAIDEPELSLHPALQRRLAGLLFEYASDRQIVIATHSPYFVEPKLLGNGARITRVSTSSEGTALNQLSETTGLEIARLSDDLNNPHALGLNAREAFFQEDGVLLLEGQEDVQLLKRVEDQVGIDMSLSPFGWGVGGADKMPIIVKMFKELGYKKVLGILDANKSDIATELSREYSGYWFGVLAADDIRSKKARNMPIVKGLLDESYVLRPEFVDLTRKLLSDACTYLDQEVQSNGAG